jgi:hypothetical protein
MANRKVIYEACFEDYLRTAGVPYVAVDEAKKAIFAGVQLKSFDFVVYSAAGPNLLVDVKGRRFTGRGDAGSRAGGDPAMEPGAGKGGHGRRWENWATRDDLDSLARWEQVFGSGFAGLLVFCYYLPDVSAAAMFETVHVFRGESYGMVAVDRAAYCAACRARSRAWDTVSVPTAAFREMIRPVRTFL